MSTRTQISGAPAEIFESPQALVTATEKYVLATLTARLETSPIAYMAISGGSTPKPLYSLLATEAGVFDRVRIYFVDERNVGPEDNDSNYRMVREAWLKSGNVPAENVHRIKGELQAQTAAREYEAELHAVAVPQQNGFPRFDLILLGMGPDGHTASLFPDTAALHEDKRFVVANFVPKLNTNRITLTFPVINNAASVAFLVAGSDKAPVLSEIARGNSTLPAALIKPVAGELTWFLDQPAAARL
ncbi:MAG: 6-phosphogluconolactonase [Acidobacteriaceae bacterium]